MTGTLIWSGETLDALRAEVSAVNAAKEHKPFWGEEVGPGLMLVADQGVYLMGWQVRPDTPAGQRAPVAFANGCHPDGDPDWYDTKVRIIGGDDTAEFLPIDVFKDLDASVREVRIDVTKRSFNVRLVGRRSRRAS
ncbi:MULTISPECIES: DUF3085 domain-containing protein [Alphaproteobacteria]|jgi:hypothetical protein|uniref:DUF3085 domain-containing protein n=1 Tax=Maricaulis virginensis TaxID=144022 RepID=A0A9W6MPS2_9PROT|nr:DUF3085 domain-containing protein [Maricaulis virginensis]GLK53518.1 hypothetical protein GCM10017621_30260 [Maricaulis virginensis]